MQRVGPYVVQGQLGQGGMGRVLRAVDPRSGAAVAVKVLLGRDGAPVQRLAREAQALSRLVHDNVVRVLDAGLDHGAPWLAMELVEGRSLEDRLAVGGPLPLAEAARVARDVARGLEHAHAQGVLHRDVKPSNVLLPADGGPPRLGDFGLAALLDEGHARLTRTGTIMGTPGYWAPEQVTGQREEVGRATDVYGLGATLYAALTGQPPFVEAELPALMVATTSRPPRPPSALRPEVDPALDDLVLRCLAKRPADRPASAGAV
ncbi:MAG: serine/threonine protein kinase, partial [Planctomycetes bacterium]|nr:serine/threonine protein kinase [Planctomycetota bacterium]